ncbi:MAG TPA: response regulator transcription factor [Chloroflexota bacterium]|nr:response regulator transcription factor [Chloroflexota bacterium]
MASKTAGIRVMIVDDHTIVRQGIQALLALETDIQVIAETGDGVVAVRLAKELQPDVVLMDVQLPGLSGIEATRTIRQMCPRTEVLAMTMHDSSHYVISMLKAGARGYLLKEAPAAEVMSAIRAVHRGQSVLHQNVTGMVVDQVNQRAPQGVADETLTMRERQILELVAIGQTSREIAERLGLSVKTVDNYRTHVLQKLNARNKVEAITIALQRGLIQIPSNV